MTPRSQVGVIGSHRTGEAGVVERVEKNKAGEVVGVTVKMDLDSALEHFTPDELRVLLPH